MAATLSLRRYASTFCLLQHTRRPYVSKSKKAVTAQLGGLVYRPNNGRAYSSESKGEKKSESEGKSKGESNGTSFASGVKALWKKLWPHLKLPLSVIIVTGTGIYAWMQVKEWYDRYQIHSSLALSGGTLNPAYIHREPLESELKRRCLSPEVKTLLITGPRGVGKTSLSFASLSNIPGVIIVCEGDTTTKERVVLNIARQLRLRIPENPNEVVAFVQGIFRMKKKKDPTLPIIVVDADDRWKDEDLEKLLLLAKRWGSDEGIARFVIVLSASLASLSINVSYTELRCKTVFVNEPTEDVVKQFWNSVFTKMERSEEEKCQLVDTCLKLPIRNFAQLGHIIEELYSKPDLCRLGVKEVEQIIHKSAKRLIDECYSAVAKFSENCGHSASLLLLRLFDSDDAEVGIRDASQVLKISRNEFLHLNHSIRPHLFSIDVQTGIVSVPSTTMRFAIKTYLEHKHKSNWYFW